MAPDGENDFSQISLEFGYFTSYKRGKKTHAMCQLSQNVTVSNGGKIVGSPKHKVAYQTKGKKKKTICTTACLEALHTASTDLRCAVPICASRQERTS